MAVFLMGLEFFKANQSQLDRIVGVMGIVSDAVGNVHDLRLEQDLTFLGVLVSLA